MPRYRGLPGVSVLLTEDAHALSSIANENNPGATPYVTEIKLATLNAFTDEHAGVPFGTFTIGGTGPTNGDAVSCALLNAAGLIPATPTATAASDTNVSLATKLVTAINASAAGTGLNKYITASNVGGTSATITLTAYVTGAVGTGIIAAQLNVQYTPSASPGGAGHATVSPAVATLLSPQNSNLHQPIGNWSLQLAGTNGSVGGWVDLSDAEPILLDASVYAQCVAAGVTFLY